MESAPDDTRRVIRDDRLVDKPSVRARQAVVQKRDEAVEAATRAKNEVIRQKAAALRAAARKRDEASQAAGQGLEAVSKKAGELWQRYKLW